MNSVNYTPQSSGQALGAAMMPMDMQNAQQPSMPSNMGSLMGLNPQQMQQMMQASGGAGLQGMSMFGGAGNPLGLSSGSQFSPADISKLQGAFANG